MVGLVAMLSSTSGSVKPCFWSSKVQSFHPGSVEKSGAAMVGVHRRFLLRVSLIASMFRRPAAVEADEAQAGSPSLQAGAQRFMLRDDFSENRALVKYLQQYGLIKSSKVAEIMVNVDRGLFVPSTDYAYEDTPMPIGFNATISAPHMHAKCLELLEENLQPGMHALDIGSGTGYLTACFALMVGPNGRAVGVEHIPELAAQSIENIKRSPVAHLVKEGCLSVHVGDGREGWPQWAPYDAIHVGAAAPEIPKSLTDQLKPGGRMVIPVGDLLQELNVVDKMLDGSVTVRTVASVRYVPLTSRDAQLQD